LGGYLSDRVGRVPVLIVASFFAGPVIYLLNFVPFGWSIAILIAIGISMTIRMPVSEAYIIEHASEHKRSTILGIYYFGSRGGSGIIIPVIGYLIDHFGFYVSFTIVGATLVAMTLGYCCFMFWSRWRYSTSIRG
ncbi:MAG: MFS transporter, partial [Dehalococcoidia bacterium]